IPGLENAEFLRFGSIHRNAYINSPATLSPHLALRDRPTTLFAGQLTGVEGYTESAATGLLAGINLSRLLNGADTRVPPPTTTLAGRYRATSPAFSLISPRSGTSRPTRSKRTRAISGSCSPFSPAITVRATGPGRASIGWRCAAFLASSRVAD